VLTILLVDDDPLQASVRKSVLEKQFSDVLRVGDAAEALCLVEQTRFSGRLDLVISGHHPAGIGGPAFVAELRSRMPSLPVLVLGDSAGNRAEYPGDNIYYLPRPFLPQEMLTRASQMLAQNQRKTA
jgi:CheY-like chemotaxis protein